MSQADLAPSGPVARVRANLVALGVLERLQVESRGATADEQAALARWSGWGAVPFVFDPQAADYEKFAWAREDLRRLLGDHAYAAAERTTLNAHYTDAAYVQSIWQAMDALGFRAGRVLEPGCGAGNFLAFAPEGAQMVGVELDPTTAAIAGALHTRADVRAESFADSRFREGSFDLVVGNVPFGDVVLHDPRHNGNSHRIHNHFLIKSLHLTRPGGLMAVITSRYTMDAANPAARREMAELADLLGAVRLPTGAHRRAAGTDVVTDVLVFRRREPGDAPRGENFERTVSQALEQTELRINEYFAAHPEHVLGAMTVTQADRGRIELGVVGDRNAGEALAAALQDVAARALQRDLGLSPRQAPAEAPVARLGASTTRPDRYLEAHPDQTFTRVEDGQRVPYSPPATQAAELRALLALRDVEVALLEAEARSNDDGPALDMLRTELNNRYDEYARSYGPLNRFSTRRTGRVDPETGEERVAQIRPPQGGFRQDPYASAVYALEHFDANTQTATKATIFHERVVARRTPRLGADRPEDALAICLDVHGEVRIEEVARLLGTDAPDARSRLGTLVFDEPETHRLVPAAEYLSGNIRTKLAEAQQALIEDGRFAANVSALTEVLPRDLGPAEIRATLGAAWIAPHYVQEFLREILDDPALLVEHPGGSIWAVQGRANTAVATTRWGTEKCDAVHLAHLLLEQRPIRIFDTDADGKSVPNPTATLAAQEKAGEMAERFSEWVWEEPERATALARVYNDRFNAVRPRTYDGSYLTLPGLALSFKPRPHQLDAVARIIAEPAVGLFHEVGTGKTADVVIGAMELRRLGLVHKPIVVVPNHMLEQFSREWLQLYPQAKLLAASKEDLDRDKRRLFVARCATNDWDAVVMVRSAFERVPMSLEVQRAYLEREVESIAEMVTASKRGKGLTTKRLQGMKLRAEERLKRKLDGDKDEGITFELLGADYLFVDEAHAYKNLATTSNIPGMSIEGSQRAQDLHLKLEHLRATHGRTATLATATPVSNSMAEVYTMLRYLRPDLLLAAGITSHDTWAATFARSVADVEVAPDGSGMRTQTRLKWHNLPELMRQWLLVGDVKTAEDLKLPVPAIAQRPGDGQRAPETVIVPPSQALRELVAYLAVRAERLRGRRPEQGTDNMLSVTNDGRAAALDLRLLQADTAEPQKVDVAADRIARIYQQARERTYNGPGGTPHPVRGALQIVFCDLGTPKTTRWHVYGELRERLLAKGLPRDAVRFVHEAKNDRDKADLFAACRDGRVAVLIGSTERMGVGTNIQRRAIALHHLDAPWRPSDIAQREGRILRQGNENPEVQILRYVTERSFDSYTWQTITRKADDFGKLMRGQLDVREMDDICEAALSYNEVKALATGNPLLLEHAKAKAEVQRLERLGRAHERNHEMLRRRVSSNAASTRELQSELPATETAIARLLPLDARPRDLRVGDMAFDKSRVANEALRVRMLDLLSTRGSRRSGDQQIGSLRGVPVVARADAVYDSITFSLSGVPWTAITLGKSETEACLPFTRLDKKLEDLPNQAALAKLQIKQLELDTLRAQEDMGKPFRHGERLLEERERLRALDAKLEQAIPQPIVAPALESTEGPSPGTRADQAVERWRDLLDQELANVVSRARTLEERLLARASALHEQHALLEASLPPSQGGFLMLRTGGRARHEAAHARWCESLEHVSMQQRRTSQRLKRVREYLRDSVPGYASPASLLAHERLERREPTLAAEMRAPRAPELAHRERELARRALEPTSMQGLER